MDKQPRIEDIPSGIIDDAMENDRFERWYCWALNLDLDKWRDDQARLEAAGRKDRIVHHCRTTWCNAKRDEANRHEAFMAAHDKLVEACEEVFAHDTWLMEDRENDYDAGAVYEIVKPIHAALAAVKEASFPVQIPSEGTVTGVNIRGEHHTISEPVRKGDDIGKIVGDVINEST